MELNTQNLLNNMGKFFKIAQQESSGGGGPSVRNNNRPNKPNSAPPIPPVNTPNIRPVQVKAEDKLTVRSDSVTGENIKTSGFAALKQDFDYGKYLAKHKYNIIGPGRKLGVSWKTLLKHDMDKLQPKRYRLYSDWFFSPLGTKGIAQPELRDEWRKSVGEHYENNPHHYHKIGKEQSLENQFEALADWYSVSKSKGDTLLDFNDWYAHNRDKLPLSGPARIIADFKLLNKKPEGAYFG